MNQKIESQLTKLPDSPGIYLFFDAQKELVYVGKATSLRSRVRSYFRGKRTPRPIEEMIHEVVDIKWKETDSVLEAVILEGVHIKKYRPKYNVDWKDDKSWNFIVITRAPYPTIETLRQHEMHQLTEQDLKERYLHVFGPYPGLNAKATLKILRQLFRYSDCPVFAQATPGKRPKKRQSGKACFYRQLGLCLGVCTGDISSKEYKEKVVKPLVMFLRGHKKRLVTSLETQMKAASKAHDYEEAARLRDQVASLERIHDIALLNKSFFESGKEKDQIIQRIEGYDISNLGSTGKVGSMVVFTGGEADKKEYRKFRIRTVSGQSDVDCLEEMLVRRLKHDEWPLPGVFLIDGGKPQVHRASRVLRRAGVSVPIVGIAKGPDRKKNEFIFPKDAPRDMVKWVNENQALLVRVRDEAHRFAVAYQRKTRQLKKK